jgi:hypothetical protein
MKIAVEQIISNCIELCYLGCYIGPTRLFGDDKSVIDTSMHPSSRLKKRSCLLALLKRFIEAAICLVIISTGLNIFLFIQSC